jgi:serine/threonine protein kinase
MQVQIPYKRKVHIMIQVAQALVYMHGCNPQVVHLDLKPENVLVHDNFTVRLASTQRI